jgi:hypothetical protein
MKKLLLVLILHVDHVVERMIEGMYIMGRKINPTKKEVINEIPRRPKKA